MSEYPDNFNELPDSINTVKALREGDPTLWSPRDALIHVLKRIDAGEIIGDNLIVIYETKDEDDPYLATTIIRSYKQERSTLLVGMLEEAKQMILTETDDED